MIPVQPKWSPQLAALYQSLRCDGVCCKTPPLHAILLIVQSRTPSLPGHKPILWLPDLHTCEAHKVSFSPETLLTDSRQAEIEAFAKRTRPHDFACDFGFSCFVDALDIFDDRYRSYLEQVARGVARRMGCVA